jgi:hypothetical protein
MKIFWIFFLILIFGCAAKKNPLTPTQPTVQNAIFINWDENYGGPGLGGVGCSVSWKLDGGSAVSVGDASNTQGTVILWNNVSVGGHMVTGDGLSQAVTISSGNVTIGVSDMCGPKQTIRIE